MRLDKFQSSHFDRGRPKWVEAVWLLVEWLLVSSPIPGSGIRRIILRLFGAQLGRGVVLKSGIRVKFPWRLVVGNYTWLGEDAWIDNLAPVQIGSHCCVSQGAYLCTGNHDWTSESFDLIVSGIKLEDHVWIGAKSCVGPGVTAAEGSVLTLGSVAVGDLESWSIYQGVPAVRIGGRSLSRAGGGNLGTRPRDPAS